MLYDTNVEEALISTLILCENSYNKLEGQLSVDMFYTNRHQEIYTVIQSLAASGQAYDMVMVLHEITFQCKEEITGGRKYLTSIIVRHAINVNNINQYADRLANLSQRRKINQWLDYGKRLVCNHETSVVDVWSTISEKVNSDMCSVSEKSYSMPHELTNSFINRTRESAEKGIAPSIKTGLYALDSKLNLMKGDMLIVAARPSMGKTALAQNILVNISRNEDGMTVIFNLEMPKEQIMNRLVSSQASVTMDKIFTAQGLDADDWENILNHTDSINDLNMIIDDRSGITIGQIRATLNRIRQKHGKISTIMVDYIQLIKPASVDNREREISGISNSLKVFAKEFNCVLIALSQLNRSLENRDNKRPILSDLRDSGSLEQDADQVLFIYRDEIYNENSKRKGIADLIIAKQRNGGIGSVQVKFEGEYNRFSDIT